MNRDDLVKNLTPLLQRNDIPQDARDAITRAIGSPLWSDVWIYRGVVCVLGLTVLATVFGGIYLTVMSKDIANLKLPESIVAIGSAAVGALAGLLAPSPKE